MSRYHLPPCPTCNGTDFDFSEGVGDWRQCRTCGREEATPGRRPETTAIASAQMGLALAELWHAIAKAIASAAWHMEFWALVRKVEAKQKLTSLRAEQGGDHAA